MPDGMSLSVDELSEGEDWKVGHDAAMACRDVEDVLRKGVGLFYVIRLQDEAWTKQVQAGTIPFDADRIRSMHRAYEWWLRPCDLVLRHLQEVELQFTVEHAEEFRRVLRIAKRLGEVDVEELIESLKQAEAGEAVPLTEEVWGGLSN